MKTIGEKNKLINWVERIGHRIYVIKTSRKLYDEFIENCKQDKFKGFKTEFLWWIKNNYEYSIIILLTGLLEGSKRHNDDLNFQKFLKSVGEYGVENIKSELYSDKPQYSNFYNNVLERLEDDDIEEVERRKHFEENYFNDINIEQDIKRINDNFLKLKDFRDKHIAHFTRNTEQFNITNSDLDNIINEIITIFDKYASIINNTTYIFD